MRIRDLTRLFCGQWFNSCLLIAYLTLTMILTNLLFHTQSHLKDEQMHYASLWDGKQVYSTYDTLYEHTNLENAYLRESGAQLRVERYIEALETEERFPYYICGAHAIVLSEATMPSACSISSGTRNEVKAHQINRNVIRDFPPKMHDGNTFTEEDYLWQFGDEVPVILGYAWRDSMNVGDKFQGTFMTLEMTFRVIGIADRDTYFPLFDTLTYEDDYIIMPTLRCIQLPRNEDEDFLQKAMALQNTSGYFRLSSSQPLSELVTFLDAKGQQYGMFEIRIMRIDQARLLILAISSDKHKQIYFGLMLTLGVCALISMITLSQAAIRKNARMLAIYYIVGAMPWRISLLVISQGLVIDIIALLLSTMFTMLVFPTLAPFHLLTQVVLGISICLCALPALNTFFTNSITYLKKE